MPLWILMYTLPSTARSSKLFVDNLLREGCHHDDHIFVTFEGGVQIKKMVSITRNLAPGVEIVLLKSILAVVRPAVRVDLSLGYSI
jgi:hypothetical protein